MSGKLSVVLFIFLLATPKLMFAHGGGHEKENHSFSSKENAISINNSIYATDNGVDSELPTLGDDPLGFSISNTDILSGKDSLTGVGMGDGEPMVRFEEKTDPKQKHSQHVKQKQHMEKATHEWVSPHAKGHGVAIGITVVSGLAFAALSFFRIGDGNAKDPS